MRRTRLSSVGGRRLSLLGLVAVLLLVAGCPKDGPPPQTGPSGDEGGDPQAQALTPDQMEGVQRTVQGGMSSVTRCYTEELEARNDKSFQGKVVVRILIGTSQAATKVEIGDSTLNAPKVHECIRGVVQSWEFPKLATPGWFTYPFAFSPAY